MKNNLTIMLAKHFLPAHKYKYINTQITLNEPFLSDIVELFAASSEMVMRAMGQRTTINPFSAPVKLEHC